MVSFAPHQCFQTSAQMKSSTQSLPLTLSHPETRVPNGVVCQMVLFLYFLPLNVALKLVLLCNMRQHTNETVHVFYCSTYNTFNSRVTESLSNRHIDLCGVNID